MIRHFARAVAQLGDPAIARVILLSILGSVALFAAMLVGFGWLLANTQWFQLPWIEVGIDLLGGMAALLLTWLMFPAVMVAVSSLMLDTIVETVERRHYPHRGPPFSVPLWRSVAEMAKFLGLILLLNLVALPLYFVPVINLFAFFLINGYLIGREYFDLVAMRRLSPAAIGHLRVERRGSLLVAGMAIAGLSSIPLVNLLVPVLAAAFMVHFFEAMRGDIGEDSAA